jgi:hypothetical protein
MLLLNKQNKKVSEKKEGQKENVDEWKDETRWTFVYPQAHPFLMVTTLLMIVVPPVISVRQISVSKEKALSLYSPQVLVCCHAHHN